MYESVAKLLQQSYDVAKLMATYNSRSGITFVNVKVRVPCRLGNFTAQQLSVLGLGYHKDTGN